MVSRLELAAEHNLVQRIAIDRQLERLAHTSILTQWLLSALAVGQIECHSIVAESDDRSELQAGVLPDDVEIVGSDALDHIKAARLQIREPHCGVRDR